MTRWESVCTADELPVGDVIRVDLDGKAYAVYHTQSGFYATEGLCTHERAFAGGRPCRGRDSDLPQAQQPLSHPTGKALRIPAKVDLKTFPVKSEGGKISLRDRVEGECEGAPETANRGRPAGPRRGCPTGDSLSSCRNDPLLPERQCEEARDSFHRLGLEP